jgi:hypothetical protein
MSTSLNNFFDQANNRVQANVQSLLTRAPYIQADLHSGRYFGPDGGTGIFRTALVSPTRNPNPDQGQISPAVAVEKFDDDEVKPLPGFTPIGYFTRVYETRRGKVVAIQFETEGTGARSGYSLNIEPSGSSILGEVPTSYNYFEKTRDLTAAQFQTTLQSSNNISNWPEGFPPTNPKNFLPEYARENFTGRNEPKPFLRGGHHSGGAGTPYENEDPVYFSFEIIINGASSPLFNGEIINFIVEVGGNLKGKKGLGNAEVYNRKPIIDSFCYEAMKYFKFSPLPYVENRSLLDKLFGQDPDKRKEFDALPTFDIYQTLMEKKHYVRKIDGLDTLNERNTAAKSSSFVKYGEDLIKLTFYEDVSMSTGTLLNLYKILGWSRLNGKALIPDNLLKFDCEIVITEIRNIARVRSALAVELYNSERQTIQPGDEAENSKNGPPQPPTAEQISVEDQAGPTSRREKVNLTYEASLDYPIKGQVTVITFNNGASVQKDIFSMGSSGTNPLKPFQFVKEPAKKINVPGTFDNREPDAALRQLEEADDLLKQEAISRVKSIHDQLGIQLTAPYADREALNASENGTGIISNNSSVKVKTTDFYFNGDDIIIAGPPPIDELKEADRLRKEAEFDAANAERIRQQDEIAKKEQEEKERAELEASSAEFDAELEAEEKAVEDASKQKGFSSSADQKFFEENPPPTDKANIEDFQKWMNSNANGQSFTYVSGSNVGKQATWKNTGEGPGKSADGVTGNMTKGAWAKYGQTYLNSKRVAENIQFTPPQPGSEIEDLEDLGSVDPQSTVVRRPEIEIETLARINLQSVQTIVTRPSDVSGPLRQDGSFAPPPSETLPPPPPLVLEPSPISLDTGKKIKPPPKTSKYALQVVKENLSKYRYKLYQCQFHVPTLPHPTSIDLSQAPTTPYDAHTIEISFKHSEVSFEKFDLKNLESDSLGFQNGDGFGLGNPGAKEGRYFILDNGDEIPFNPDQFNGELSVSKNEKGNPSIEKSAASVTIEPLRSMFFEVDEPGVIDKFSRGVVQDQSSSADYPNSRDALRDAKRDQRRGEFVQGLAQAGQNLFSTSKRIALSEVQKLGNDQFRLLNDTLGKVRSAYGVGGISPPKNVYEGIDPTKPDGFGKNSQTALQNAVKNFAGDIGSSFLGLL